MPQSDLEWERLPGAEVTRVGFRTIVEKKFRLPDGTEEIFHTVEKEGQKFVSVVALTEDKKIIIARQYRPGPEMIMDELPGGMVDKGEELETAARRELLEETGYEAESISFLGEISKTAYTNARNNYFLAKGCKQVAKQQLDSTEFIETDLISIDALLENARNNKLTDPVAIFLAKDELLRIKEENK